MRKLTFMMGLLLLGGGLTWGQTAAREQYKTFEKTQTENPAVASVQSVPLAQSDWPMAGIDVTAPVETVRQQIKDRMPQNRVPAAKCPKRAVKAPVQPPYYCAFDSEQQMADEWIVIDGDADGRSWYCEWNGFFYTCDSNVYSGFAAVLWNQDGEENNDWMITAAPVSLPAGTSHISFYYGLAQPFYVERLKVFYGKTPDTAMAGLTELGTFEISVRTGWYFAHVDFELAEAGDYYFSFQYRVPDDNQYGLMLDNIRIDKGAFVGTPDLQVERVILPPASCSLGSSERLGVQVKNAGSADITEWAMTYSVNGGEPVREVVSKTLAEGASDTVYFNTPADLSLPGTEYDVTVKVEVLEHAGHAEVKTYNNHGRNKVWHFSPLDHLPFEADLQTDLGRSQVGYNPDYWQPVEDEGLRALVAEPMVTRCMALAAGDRYRFIFDYKAGFNSFLISPDIFYILYGPADKPLAEWDTLKSYAANTKNAYVKDEIVFEQKEAGSFAFAIRPIRPSYGYEGTLYVSNIRVEKIFDYDVRVESVRSTLAGVMPAQHTLAPQFNIALINRGEQDLDQVKVTVKNGETEVAVSEEKAMRKNDTAYYTFGGTLVRPAANSRVTFTVTAETGHADDNPDDNTAQWSFVTNDSLYAFDDVTKETYDDGVGLQGLLLGNLFTLLEPDTLTAVVLGWMDLTQFPLEPIVRLEIYPVAESGETGDCVYAADIERPKAGGVYTVPIRPRVLKAGRYMVGVMQVGADNMVVGYDRNPLGFFYVKPARNRVQTLGGYGNLAVRAVFGKTTAAYAKEVEVLGIEQPLERGVFAANEKIVVNYRNNGWEDIALEFRCAVDGNVVSQLVEVPGYAPEGQVVFEVDLSRTGAHEILVKAVLPGDEKPDNNAVKKTVMCITEDPYVMDFELCNDFAITNLYPWKSVDVDLEFTAGIRGYDWPGCQSPMGFMAFNPYQTTPSMERLMVPHEGDRLGMAVVCAGTANNDWLISPKLTLPEKDARLSFFTRAFTELAEEYNVLISTTTDDLSAFDQLGETYTAPEEWGETVVDLSDYAGKEVYLAIQYVSKDAFVFLIDDIAVSKPVANEGLADLSRYVKSYPNPVMETWTVTAYGLEIDRVEICDMAGSVVFRSAGNLATETYRLNMDGFNPGLYMARVYTNAGVQTLKVVVR